MIRLEKIIQKINSFLFIFIFLCLALPQEYYILKFSLGVFSAVILVSDSIIRKINNKNK